MWTKLSKKSRQGSDPPPIQAMPVFWELLDRHSIIHANSYIRAIFLTFFATLESLESTSSQILTILLLPGSVGPRVRMGSHQNPKHCRLRSNLTKKATARVRSAQ